MKARSCWAVSQVQTSNRFSPQVPQEQANRAATRVTAGSEAGTAVAVMFGITDIAPVIGVAASDDVLVSFVLYAEMERDDESWFYTKTTAPRVMAPMKNPTASGANGLFDFINKRQCYCEAGSANAATEFDGGSALSRRDRHR
jgi:hypothetical protein